MMTHPVKWSFIQGMIVQDVFPVCKLVSAIADKARLHALVKTCKYCSIMAMWRLSLLQSIVSSLRSLYVQENPITNNVTVVDEYLFEERLKDF